MDVGGLSIREFSQPPHHHLPWHVHTDASICFVVSGSYTETMAGESRECEPGAMVFKPPAERHADRFGRLGGRCLLMEIGAGRRDLVAAFSSITSRPSLLRNARLASFGRGMYREFRGVDRVSPLAIEGLMLEILVEATRAREPDRAIQPPSWLVRAHDLIHDRFREALTLSSVAAEVGIHPSHLARMFRRHFRLSIGDYIRLLRIERASLEVRETDASLAGIAARAGFFDQSHFSRVFKRVTGYTPAECRAGRAARPRTHRTS